MPVLRVLVVEDDPAVLALFCQGLRDAGFEVEGVRTMAAALDALAARQFDVILTQLDLPDVATVDALAALRGAQPRSRIVVCSGVLSEELRRYAAAFGVAAVLAKPVTIEQLIEALTATA